MSTILGSASRARELSNLFAVVAARLAVAKVGHLRGAALLYANTDGVCLEKSSAGPCFCLPPNPSFSRLETSVHNQ
jgi:hypothetical protein